LKRFLDRAEQMSDGWICRENFLYHGAGTGRWSGLGLQMQNFPRGALNLKPDDIDDALAHLTDREWLAIFYGAPMTVISDCLRSLLIARKGRRLVVADYANIEGRGLPWLAGDERKLTAFRAADAKTGPGIYEKTAAGIFGVKVEDVTKAQRQIGKTAELACIAKGQLVLTDQGLVPIENVKTYQKVWDGVAWVQHKGVVCRGIKEVITYDGLTATEDHIVWTQDGRQVQFGDCASKQTTLAQTGFGRKAIWLGRGHFAGFGVEGRRGQIRIPFPVSLRARKMYRLFNGKMDVFKQSYIGQVQRLPALFSAASSSAMAIETNERGQVSVSKPQESKLGKLRGPRNRVSFQNSRSSGRLGYEELRFGPDTGNRSNQQHGALRARQFALRKPGITDAQQARYQSFTGFGALGADKKSLRRAYDNAPFAKRRNARINHKICQNGGNQQKKKLGWYLVKSQKTWVYDLVEAGPRHRFTVSDRLVHNCGYGGGVGAFQSMAKNLGVKVPDAEADKIKSAWRESHPEIVNYWYALERAAMNAVREPGIVFSAGAKGRESAFKVAGNVLWLRLPSFRVIAYPDPKIKPVETPWGEMKDAVTFMGVDAKTHKWSRQKTYGGSLAENVTQAICRDLLAEAIIRLESAGYPIVMHAHDEAVADVPKGFGSLKEFEAIMCASESWAAGMPVVSEGYEALRYRK
jgi:DNA polymerase